MVIFFRFVGAISEKLTPTQVKGKKKKLKKVSKFDQFKTKILIFKSFTKFTNTIFFG